MNAVSDFCRDIKDDHFSQILQYLIHSNKLQALDLTEMPCTKHGKATDVQVFNVLITLQIVSMLGF